MRHPAPFWLLAVGLAGCNDPAVERGTPPAIVFQPASYTVPLYGYAPARRLRRDVERLAAGNGMGGLRAEIETTSPGEVDAARSQLISLGLDPAAITTRFGPSGTVTLHRTMAVTPSCAASLSPGWFGDVSNSLDSLGTCVQASNLAAMVQDPADLVSPTHLYATNGAVAARAVNRWEQEQSAAAPPSPAVQSGAAGGGEGPTQAAPAIDGAALSNPLLSSAPLVGSPGGE